MNKTINVPVARPPSAASFDNFDTLIKWNPYIAEGRAFVSACAKGEKVAVPANPSPVHGFLALVFERAGAVDPNLREYFFTIPKVDFASKPGQAPVESLLISEMASGAILAVCRDTTEDRPFFKTMFQKFLEAVKVNPEAKKSLSAVFPDDLIEYFSKEEMDPKWKLPPGHYFLNRELNTIEASTPQVVKGKKQADASLQKQRPVDPRLIRGTFVNPLKNTTGPFPSIVVYLLGILKHRYDPGRHYRAVKSSKGEQAAEEAVTFETVITIPPEFRDANGKVIKLRSMDIFLDDTGKKILKARQARDPSNSGAETGPVSCLTLYAPVDAQTPSKTEKEIVKPGEPLYIGIVYHPIDLATKQMSIERPEKGGKLRAKAGVRGHAHFVTFPQWAHKILFIDSVQEYMLNERRPDYREILGGHYFFDDEDPDEDEGTGGAAQSFQRKPKRGLERL